MQKLNCDIEVERLTTKQMLRVFEAQDEMRVNRIKNFLQMRYGRSLEDVHIDMEWMCQHIATLEAKVQFLEKKHDVKFSG